MNKLIITLILLILSTFSYGQLFEDEQKFEIRDSSIILLSRYAKYADLSSDGVSVDEEYVLKFQSLFTKNYFSKYISLNSDDSKLVNDVSGKKQFITPDEYIELVKEKYVGGIEVKLDIDSMFFKNLKKVSEETFSVQIDLRKYTIGLSKQDKIIRKDIDATFTIYFSYVNDTLFQFRIKEIISKEIILQRKSDKKMKGFYLGFNFHGFAGRLQTDNNIQYYNRDYQISGTFSGGVFVDYYLSSHYALSIGADYYSFNSNFRTRYNNGTDNNLPGTDIDNDSYFLYVNSDFSENNNLKYISIPLKLKYRHRLYDGISFFTSLGISGSRIFSSDSYIFGNSVHTAWYEEYSLLVDEAELYNLGTKEYNDEFELDINKQFFSGSLAAGISVPVQKASYLNITAEINHSFSNINYNSSTYRDDYLNIFGKPENIYIQSAGITVSYLFKL